MKAKTLCALVLGLSIGLGACGKSNDIANKPIVEYKVGQWSNLRTQETRKYLGDDDPIKRFFDEYTATHKGKGIEIKPLIEYGRITGVQVRMNKQSAYYHGLYDDILNSYLISFRKIKIPENQQ